MKRVTITDKRGNATSFDSPYSDDEVVSVLRGLMGRGRVMSSFADDLLRQTDGGRRLSQSQLNWVHKLVHDAEARTRDRVPTEVTGHTRKPGSHNWSHPGS
jgi:hypothetical protein